MDPRIRCAVIRLAILAGHAATAYLDGDANPRHGDGTTEDFTGLVGLTDVMIVWNCAIFKVLDLATVNTTIYAIGLFCLFFNCRVLTAAASYSQLLEAIEYYPTTIHQLIPTSLIQTHGFPHSHIIMSVWDFIQPLHSGIHNGMTHQEMWALLHQPLPLPLHSLSPTSFTLTRVDILNLLVTAAANNSM